MPELGWWPQGEGQWVEMRDNNCIVQGEPYAFLEVPGWTSGCLWLACSKLEKDAASQPACSPAVCPLGPGSAVRGLGPPKDHIKVQWE